MLESERPPIARPRYKPGRDPEHDLDRLLSEEDEGELAPREPEDPHRREVAAPHLERDARVVVDDADRDGGREEREDDLQHDEDVALLGANEARGPRWGD